MEILPYSVAEGALSPLTYTGVFEFHSYLPPSPPPNWHPVPFASATLRRRLRPRSADMLVRILLLMSRPTRRLNELAAIDKLTLARHVADFPKTCQTRPTSPSTPRATTGSSTWWVEGIVGR